VTAASGFLGKLVIEKLPRTFKGIKKVFVLIRPKKNKPARERLDQLLGAVIFDRLRSECKENDDKSVPVAQAHSSGSNQSWCPFRAAWRSHILVSTSSACSNEVSVIRHSVIVSIVDKLKTSAQVNEAGLQLACKLPKLCALIHASTIRLDNYCLCRLAVGVEHRLMGKLMDWSCEPPTSGRRPPPSQAAGAESGHRRRHHQHADLLG
jgi:hypothetical protein